MGQVAALEDRIYLYFLEGPCKGQRLDITSYTTLVLGRENPRTQAESRFTVEDITLSRRHLLLTASADGLCFYLEDLDSANGTWLNEEPLQPHTRIRLVSGDKIKAGINLIKFVDMGGTEAIRLNANKKTAEAVPEPKTAPQQSTIEIKCDPENGRIWVYNKPLSLTPKEFRFLNYLYQHRSQVCSYEDLLQNIWKDSAELALGVNNVQQLVRGIRRKIDQLNLGFRGEEVVVYNSVVRGYHLVLAPRIVKAGVK